MNAITLPRSGFLREASPALVDLLAGLAREVRLCSGQVLFQQGDAGEALYAVISGALEISVLSADGRRFALDLMGPGALLGEISLFDPGPRTATATAVAETTALRVTHADMLHGISNSPELAADMVRLAGQRMRRMDEQIAEQAFLTLPARLARRVLYLADTFAESGAPKVQLSQARLADYVGVSREAVAKTLADWKRAGLVAPARRGLTVLDSKGLREIAYPDEI